MKQRGKETQMLRRNALVPDDSHFGLQTFTATTPYSAILMARIYPSLGLLCFSILALLHSLVLAHMIEVPAGNKECFFEDLHKNDKVRMELLTALLNVDQPIDDGNIPSWRWRSP
jgi:hypothetical protein